MSLPRCTATCATALALTLLSPRAARASSVDVGSFTKNSTTGNQTVSHNLGETPVALVLWTDSQTNESFTSTFQFGIGFTDGTNSRSGAGASEDNKSSGVTSRRLANKALTIVDYSQGTVAEADLSSWNSTGFTLNWTTNTASTGYVVHYLAIGGYEVSAKVFTWVLPVFTGNQSVTGVTFQPNLVLCFHAGPGFTSTPPNSSTHSTLGLSAMDDAGNQWANAYMDADSANPAATYRYQRTTKAIAILSTSGTVAKEASWVSMDSDGFTVNFSSTDFQASKAMCLALKGVAAYPGSFNKSTAAATATQTVTGVPFKPKAVLLASVQGVTSSSVGTVARLGLGASNVSTNGASALQSTGGGSKSSVDSIDKTSKAFVKVDNSTPAIDAEATVTGFNTDGFTLSWSTNDSVATEVLYLAVVRKRRILVVE